MNQEQWARALLGRLGYKATNANVTAVLAWMRAEGGNWNNTAHYNPLNTTQKMPGATSMNSVGVKSYTSWEQGLDATVKTLKNGYYGSILSSLKAGTSANGIANSVVNSPWGTKNISVSGITVSGESIPSGSSYALGATVPKLDLEALAQQYGLTYAMIKGDKQLLNLFNEAVKNTYDSTLFQAKLKNTKWWRTQSDPLRKYLLMKAGDPATWKQKTGEANFAVNQLAVSVGLGNQFNSKNQASKLLQQATYNQMALGWSDARLKSWFAAQVHIDNGANSVVGGEVGEVFNQLHELAYNNGMRYSDWYGREARNIVAGKSTIQAAEGNIRREAAARYGAFAEQIRAGQNVLDLAQPYIASVASILELPSSDIDLFNKYVSKAMTAKPDKNGAQYPLWQFETELRSDPLWRKTNNAREGMMSVARQVARDFGMAW